MDTIEDIRHTVAKLKESSWSNCKITIAHHEIARPLTASGIPQLHFDQLHAMANHLHVMKYGEDYDLWGDCNLFWKSMSSPYTRPSPTNKLQQDIN
jgi:hypothetical protein